MSKEQEIISGYMAKIAKKSHKKSPRQRAHFVEMQKKSVAARKAAKVIHIPA